MDNSVAQKIIDTWFGGIGIQNDIPLFRTLDDGLTLNLVGGLIRRSDAFNNCISRIKGNVMSTFGSRNCPNGVLYLVYKRSADQLIEPLYVGKAETIGKTGGLSALFQSAGAIRFADGIESKGHIGMLNEAWMFARGLQYRNRATKNDYARWVSAFIVDPLQDPILLRTPVFVSMEEWNPWSDSIVPSLGHMSIKSEEMLRIDLLRQGGCGGELLNS